MTRTPDEAISFVYAQSKYGPTFPVNECKMRTRIAYGVPSDGSQDATEARSRTKVRLDCLGTEAPRGALLWWTGGSQGHGHVAIADGKGGVWSVDIKRHGYWDHVPFQTIHDSWPLLKWAGVSLDIDGVQVVPTPEPKEESAVSTTNPFAVNFKARYNHERVIDLHLLELAIKSGRPHRIALAASVCRAACRSAVYAFLKVAG